MGFHLAFSLLLTVTGGAVLASLAKNVLSFFTFHFLPFGDSLKKYRRQPRAWALVTGSSAGIGFGQAQELVKRGFGVIVLAHLEHEINEAVTQIKAECKDAAVENIVLDATTASYLEIESALAPYMHFPITILVNNVAVQTSRPVFTTFGSYEPGDIDKSITANNTFMCYISRILYPVLKKNGPSLMINLSSGAQVAGAPWLAMYCGTKGFVASWSKSIAREAQAEGDAIDSIAILPGDVHSQGNRYAVAPGSPTARDFAKMLLDRVGRAVDRGHLSFSPYWKHDLQIKAIQYLPESWIAPELVATIARRRIAEAEAKAKAQ